MHVQQNAVAASRIEPSQHSSDGDKGFTFSDSYHILT
jgi:hypothetical protein